ncbi:GerMN domain-containing protein [Malonomonas rubra]|uniref:GerMN domain-containing protein n=1 Tax=Malonomonas rubra TaxID=57040 RepID=UPI0026EE4134|nr:GerMN domain-containing protein [Malonomonas rubra]
MKKLLLMYLGLLLVGGLIGYGVGWFGQQEQLPDEGIPIVVEEDLPQREVQLYFADPGGTYLVAESRLIKGCDDDRDCIRSLLEATRAGSQQGLLPVLPKETGILEIELENDLARVNFSRHLADFHPGGSLSELLTVYSLANSLSENFSYLRQLQILIDGEVRQTLKGHVRIDQPIYPDFSYSDPSKPGLLPEKD